MIFTIQAKTALQQATRSSPLIQPGAERLEFGFHRVGLLRASLRHRVGGVTGRAIERGVEAESGGVVAREAADEGVAGAGRNRPPAP